MISATTFTHGDIRFEVVQNQAHDEVTIYVHDLQNPGDVLSIGFRGGKESLTRLRDTINKALQENTYVTQK